MDQVGAGSLSLQGNGVSSEFTIKKKTKRKKNSSPCWVGCFL